MPKWQEEFPDYPVADMPAIPPEFVDCSFHNDACPCFEMGLYLIWVDYADQGKRETPEGMPRFGVASDAGEWLYQSDDWAGVLEFFKKEFSDA